MSKGPAVCKRYLEEFDRAERADNDFRCARCHEHPNWHDRLPIAAQPGSPNLFLLRIL